MEPLLSWMNAFSLLGTRIAGLFLIAPFFSHAAIPMRIKAGFTVLLTILLYPVISPNTPVSVVPNGLGFLLRESIVGVLIGLSSVLTFEAAQFAGHCLGVEVGVSLVSVLDPQTQAESPVLAVLLQTLLLLFFLALNIHHWLLRALAHSFQLIPPGSATLSGVLTGDILKQSARIWILGVEIAAPVLAATLLADLVMAFLAKASPQMPVLLVGMPVKFVLGLTVLWAGLRSWPTLFDKQFALALETGERWLRLAH